MRIPYRLAAFVAAGALLAACGDVPPGAAAQVGGREISIGQVERLVRAQADNPESPLASLPQEQRLAQVSQLQSSVLSTLVQIELMEFAVEEYDLDVTDADVDERWQEEAELQGGEEQLQARLDELGLDEEGARDQLRAAIIQQRLRDLANEDAGVGEEELRQAYEERKDQYQTVTASHILVETEQEALDLKQQIEQGTDFAELAREHSTDPGSAAQGGSLGAQPRGTFVPEFEDAIWSAEEGDLVGPVQTQFGFHLIKVEGFETQSFEDVRDQLQQELQGAAGQERFGALLDELIEAADVTIAPRFGRFDPQQVQIVPAGPLVPTSQGGMAPQGGAVGQ